MNFGSTTLAIPHKYLLPKLPPTIVPGTGLDADSGVLIKVPLTDLGIEPVSRGGLTDSLIVLISGTSNSESTAQLAPDTIDAWNAAGLYQDRIIEFDETVNLYRVYPRAGHPLIWQYFKASPLEGGSPEALWVASCMAPPGTDGTALIDISCQIISRYKSVESQITLAGKNIQALDAINDGYCRLLARWDKAL